MHRVDFHEDHLLLLINDHVRPLGKTVLVPEEPVLLGNGTMRPEVTEERGIPDRQALCPCLFAGHGIDTDADRHTVSGDDYIAFFLQRFHLGCAVLRPCERVKGEKYAFTCQFIEIEGLVVLVLLRKIPCSLSDLHHTGLCHNVTCNGVLAFGGDEVLDHYRFLPE